MNSSPEEKAGSCARDSCRNKGWSGPVCAWGGRGRNRHTRNRVWRAGERVCALASRKGCCSRERMGPRGAGEREYLPYPSNLAPSPPTLQCTQLQLFSMVSTGLVPRLDQLVLCLPPFVSLTGSCLSWISTFTPSSGATRRRVRQVAGPFQRSISRPARACGCGCRMCPSTGRSTMWSYSWPTRCAGAYGEVGVE